MFHNKKDIKSNTTEDSNKIKKKFSFLDWILIILVIIIFCLVGYYVYTFIADDIKEHSLFTNYTNVNDKLENNISTNIDNNKINLEELINKNANKIEELIGEINVLTNDLVSLRGTVKDLHIQLIEAEKAIQEINISPYSRDLIRVALNIQKEIDEGQNFSNNLTILKSLAKQEKNITDKLIILEAHKNKVVGDNMILNTFHEEMKNFIENYNIIKDNKFLKIFSSFITVRKTNNPIDKANIYANELEMAINTSNYNEALEILEKNNEYNKYFTNTMNNLNIKVSLNNSINYIINYFVNK